MQQCRNGIHRHEPEYQRDGRDEEGKLHAAQRDESRDHRRGLHREPAAPDPGKEAAVRAGVRAGPPPDHPLEPVDGERSHGNGSGHQKPARRARLRIDVEAQARHGEEERVQARDEEDALAAERLPSERHQPAIAPMTRSAPK